HALSRAFDFLGPRAGLELREIRLRLLDARRGDGERFAVGLRVDLGDEIALLHCVAFFVAHACESTADAKRELDLTDVDVAVEREAVGAVARPHDEPSREAYGHDRGETEDHQHAFLVHRDGSACTIAAMLRRSCARMSASSDAPSSDHCISRMTHARA